MTSIQRDWNSTVKDFGTSQQHNRQGDHSFSTMIFHDFSTTKKMNFHDLSAQHIFFEINDTRFMNAYQNKNIFPVARQSVSK